MIEGSKGLDLYIASHRSSPLKNRSRRVGLSGVYGVGIGFDFHALGGLLTVGMENDFSDY